MFYNEQPLPRCLQICKTKMWGQRSCTCLDYGPNHICAKHPCMNLIRSCTYVRTHVQTNAGSRFRSYVYTFNSITYERNALVLEDEHIAACIVLRSSYCLAPGAVVVWVGLLRGRFLCSLVFNPVVHVFGKTRAVVSATEVHVCFARKPSITNTT